MERRKRRSIGFYRTSLKRVINSNIKRFLDIERNLAKQLKKEYKKIYPNAYKKMIDMSVAEVHSMNKEKINFYLHLKAILPSYKEYKKIDEYKLMWFKEWLAFDLNKSGDKLSQKANFMYKFLSTLEDKQGLNLGNIEKLYEMFGDYTTEDLVDFSSFVVNSFKDDTGKSIGFFYDYMNKVDVSTLIEDLRRYKENDDPLTAYDRIKSYLDKE